MKISGIFVNCKSEGEAHTKLDFDPLKSMKHKYINSKTIILFQVGHSPGNQGIQGKVYL